MLLFSSGWSGLRTFKRMKEGCRVQQFTLVFWQQVRCIFRNSRLRTQNHFLGMLLQNSKKDREIFLAASQLILINAVVDAIVHQTTRSFSKTFLSLLFWSLCVAFCHVRSAENRSEFQGFFSGLNSENQILLPICKSLFAIWVSWPC